MWFGRSCRKRLRNQLPESDDEFLSQINVPASERDVALMVRRVLATMCKVEDQCICAHQNPMDLHGAMSSRMLDGWDHLDFVFRLEKISGRKVSLKTHELPPFLRAEHVGGWVLRVVAILKDHWAT